MCPTPQLEYDVGGQIADALAERDGTPPCVRLVDPDVLVNAEVLGASPLLGVVRSQRQRTGYPGGASPASSSS